MRFVLHLVAAWTLAAQVSTTLTAPPQGAGAAAPAGVTAPVRPEDACGIEGQVFNSATGEPIKKANLVLRRTDRTAGVMGNSSASYSTSTDAGGRFGMKDIDPGKYQLSVERTGFVSTQYGARGPGRPGTTLSLAPGQQLKNVVFRLLPHGVISGRVLDEDGEPVAYAQVQTMRYRYLQGRKQLMPFGGGMTNDLGEYRIFGLAPGRYFLSATSRGGMMFEATLDRSANPAPEEGYVPTYYPGTTDPASAAPIDLQPGTQLRGLDLTLSKARTVRLRGRVVNATGTGRSRIQLMLLPRDGVGIFGANRGAAPDPEGRFEIRGVSPGAYNLMASTFDGQKSMSVTESVDVGSANIDNLNLVIQPGADITGQVRVEGQTQVNLSTISVALRARDSGAMMFRGATGGAVKEDGTFTLSGASAENYNLSLSGLPDGYYLKAVLMADKDVLETGINLTKGPAGPLTVVLSPNAAQVEGVVLNAKQQPAAGVTVVLIPKDEKRREQQQYYKSVTTDQYGRYALKNVDPGEYRLFAWEDLEYGAYMDPDFVKPVEDRGQSVSLRESSRESVQLSVIPSDDAQEGSQRTTQNQ